MIVPDAVRSEIDRWRLLSRDNNALIYEYLARAHERRWRRWPDARAADAGTATSHFNSATLCQPMAETTVENLVGRLNQFYDTGDGGPWHLWSPWPTPDLRPFGFVLVGQPPLMVRPPGLPQPRVPPELTVIEAAAQTALGHWSHVFVAGFPAPEEQGSARPLVDARALGGPLRFWVGYVADQPVTCALSCLDGAMAGVHMVATLPTARARGYGAAITSAASAVDPALPTWLVASDAGRRVYERLGYTTVARYTLWRKERAERENQDERR